MRRKGYMRTYTGRTVVITGAAGGMGRAFARRFAAAGARLALLDLKHESVSAFTADLQAEGVEAEAVTCDVTDFVSCSDAIAKARRRFSSVDVLIANAGITHRSALRETDLQVYRKVMDVNYFGAVNCAKAALEDLISARGQIIVISSIAGFSPLLGRSGYAASKYALHGFFDTARTELAPHGVGVTIVCPGFTATGITTAALDGDGKRTRHPQSTLGRIASPDEVAEKLFRAASRNQRLLVLSKVGRTTRLLTRLAPGVYEKLMARSLRRELER